MSAFNVSELNNLFTKLEQISGNSSNSSNSSNDAAFLNSIFTVGNSAAQIGQAKTSEEKANAVNNLVKQALSIFEKIAGNEAKVAKNEVKKQSSKTEKLVQKSENLTVELEGKFNKVAKSIDNQTQIVEKANSLLEKTQKSIEKKQKKIQEIVEKIAEKQEELKSATTEDEKAKILTEIQGFATNIAKIGLTIEADNENIQNLTEAVENTTENIEAATNEMAVVEQDGIAQIQQTAQEAGQAGTEIAQTGTKGATNKVTGEAAQKAAEAASTNILSGTSIAPKLYKTANDQNQASQTRLSSIRGNINRVAQGIGGLNNATEIIASFQNSIGGALGNYSELVGQWDTAVEPVIVSLGSFSELATATEELNENVEADLKTLGYENENGKVQKTETEKDIEQKPEENTQKVELATENFDIQKLRTFGV